MTEFQRTLSLIRICLVSDAEFSVVERYFSLLMLVKDTFKKSQGFNIRQISKIEKG